MLSEQANSNLQSLESFTGREQDVMQDMAKFQTNEEIAENLYISVKTVRWYIKQIYSKLGVNNRVKAIEVIQTLYDTNNEETTQLITLIPEPQVVKSIPIDTNNGMRQELFISILIACILLLLVTGVRAKPLSGRPDVEMVVYSQIIENDNDSILIVDSCTAISDDMFGPCIIPFYGGVPQAIIPDFPYPFWTYAGWSPDGEQVVFSVNSENSEPSKMYIVNRDGSTLLELLPDFTGGKMGSSWSPDGEWIAFHYGGRLAIIHSDGTGLQTIWSTPRHMICANFPQWSADSEQVIFSVASCTWTAPVEREIVMVSLSGLRQRTLVSTYYEFDTCGAGIDNVAFNLDSTKFAYTDGECNHILQDIETGETTRLVEFPIAWTASAYPQWSGGTPPMIIESPVDTQMIGEINDTSLLLATFCDDMTVYSSDIFGLCILPLNGGVPEVVLPDFPYPSGGRVAWSPQGDQLIFSAHKYDDHESPTLFIAYLEVNDWREFLSGYDNIGQANPSWSPDGQWIAFQMSNGIVIIHPDGTGLQTIWQSPDDNIVPDQPQWSPDSRQVIFSSGTNGWLVPTARDIIIISLVDSSARTIAKTNHVSETCEIILENLAFNPDGTQIAYTDGDCNHILQDIDSGAVTMLDEFPIQWTNVVYPQWSDTQNPILLGR